MRLRAKPFLTLIVLATAGTVALARSGPIAPQTAEETRLWARAEEEQQIIEKSGFVIEDAALSTYLTSIVDRLAAVDGLDSGTFSVRVLRDPTLNAFAFPSGRIYIHAGLLARMLNEAQLAAVLGHEMTHVTDRHALKGYRDVKSKVGILAVAINVSGDYGSLVQLLGGLGTMAAVSGYSRGMEREADVAGWHRMAGSGYDTAEAPVVFRLLMSDLKAHDRKEPFFFGSHPRLAERERNFVELDAARKGAGGTEKGAERFAAATMPVLLINGEMEMRAGRHDAARDQLWRYRAARPYEVRVRWLLGENERVDKEKDNQTEARKLLEEALLTDPEFAPAHRSLGLLHYRAHAYAAAALHLTRFLELDPAAHDRAYLEAYLQQCQPSEASPSPP